jgi:hypothetical protein
VAERNERNIPMTQYLLSVYITDEEIANTSEAEMQAAFAAVDVFNQELQESGAWVFAGGLHPASTATVVKPSDGDTVVTDGPYVETKEWLVGFYLIDCSNEEEALERARMICPLEDHAIEVRPVQWRWKA